MYTGSGDAGFAGLKDRAKERARRATRTARRTAQENPVAVIVGVILVVVVLLVAVSLTKAAARRRRRTLLQRTLAHLNDLGGHREHIAARLKSLIDEHLDGGALAEEVSKRIEAVERELGAVDQAIAAFKEQGKRLTRQVRS